MKIFYSREWLCQKIGFEDILIDDSNSQVGLEIPEEIWEESNPGRSKVHVGVKDFEHLADYDMDKIRARACVVARKPNPQEKWGWDEEEEDQQTSSKRVNNW